MAVIFQDTFTEASATVLSSHTPSPTGTAWTNEEQTGIRFFRVEATNDNVEINANSGNNRNVYSCTPAPSTAEYDVETALDAITGSNDAPLYAIGRFADTSNYYGGGAYAAAEAADSKIWKLVSGTATELASGDTGWVNGDVLKFEIRDATKKLYKNGSEVISSTDNALTSAGKAGMGAGNSFVSTDDMAQDWRWDDYTVTTVDAGGRTTKNIRAFPLGMDLGMGLGMGGLQ